jgi:hypothetical protein
MLGQPMPRASVEPPHPGASCSICGAACDGAAVRSKVAIKSSFSDHRDLRLPASEWCCCACTWSMEGKPPDTFRMWSVVWREDQKTPVGAGPSHWQAPGLYLTNKGDTSELLSMLLDPPRCRWAMAVADSGKIHTMVFAPINLAGSTHLAVRHERNDVRCLSSEFSEIHTHVEALLRAGYAKRDVLGGNPQPSSLLKRGIDVWRHHGLLLRRWSSSPLLALAVALSKKPT